jgi:hypothetical protein
VQVRVADLEVGGVEADIRELDMAQGAVLEGRALHIEAGADPRYLRAGDPRADPQRLDQVIHTARRDALHIRLGDHRVQGLIDPPARLEQTREERPRPQLGDLQLHVPGLGGQQPRPVPVALRGSRLAALVALGADRLGRFGLDQLPEDQTDRLADQVDPLPRPEHLQQLGQGRIIKGHRRLLTGGFLAKHTEDHADGSPNGGPLNSPQTPRPQGTPPDDRPFRAPNVPHERGHQRSRRVGFGGYPFPASNPGSELALDNVSMWAPRTPWPRSSWRATAGRGPP